MNAPADRILELALEEVLGGHRPPDLEARILADIRRRPRTLRRYAWAAAALLLLGLGVRFALSPSRPTPQPQPPVAVELDAAERALAAGWIALQRESTIGVRPTTPEGVARLKGMRTSRRQLLDLLDEKPAGWPWVRERILPLPEGIKALDVRMRLIRVLGRDPDPVSQAFVLEQLEARRYTVNEATLLVLAERGRERAHDELAARLAGDAPAPPYALPGVYFALRGDDRGAGSMRLVVASSGFRDAQPATALASAAGLRRLGDNLPWTVTIDALETRLGARLAADDLDEARRIVAGLDLARGALDEGSTFRVGDLERRAARLGRGLASSLATAEAIRARFDDLRRE